MVKSVGRASGSTVKKSARSGRFVNVKRSAKSGQFIESVNSSEPMPTSRILATTRLKKAGGSLVMTVPAAARNLLHLSEGQEMAVSVEGSKVVLEAVVTDKPQRVRRPKYTLDELLAGAEPVVKLSDEERAWQDSTPVGQESW